MSVQPALQLPSVPSIFDPSARRVEIDELLADNVLTNLFLLATQDIRQYQIKAASDANEDWHCFYDLGEIHGYPFELWRGVKNRPPQQTTNGFYCTHGSLVFPTWHRLYIHMYEQGVYRAMERIANSFPSEQKDVHIQALKRFRLPYWDPCLPRVAISAGQNVKDMFDMPLILKSPRVFVVDPVKGPTSINNPLLNFTFPSDQVYKATGRAQIDWMNQLKKSQSIAKILEYGRSVTVRTPDGQGKTDDQLFLTSIQENYYELNNDFFQLLHPSRVPEDLSKWDTFSNHGSNGQWPANVSLESWHDNIHGLVGSGSSYGHMVVVPVAAFDPIFYLHHNNIDRMFALYQAMYEYLPDTFVPDTTTQGVSASTELAPFAIGSGQQCFTSNDIKDWTSLGFAVPGDKHLDEAGRAAVAQYIMNVYEWASEKTRPPDTLGYPLTDVVSNSYAISGKNFQPATPAPVQFLSLKAGKIVNDKFSSTGKPISAKPLDLSFNLPTDDYQQYPLGYFIDRENAKMRTWSLLMKVKKYTFRQSFNVQIFIGQGTVPPDSEGAEFFIAPNQAGYSTIFAFDPDSECDNCENNRDMIYTDVITITPKLREYLKANEDPSPWPPANLRALEDLEPNHVVPFLTNNLEWRIVMPDGQVRTAQDVTQSGLQLLLADSVYEYPVPGSGLGPLGRYGPWTHHPEATRGKIGGDPAA